MEADGQPDLHEGAIKLGRPKGNTGNQNDDIPADVDVDRTRGRARVRSLRSVVTRPLHELTNPFLNTTITWCKTCRLG
ncbi:hypothetical protein BH24ACT15_BH24ACT15_34560 [soil metagenome]